MIRNTLKNTKIFLLKNHKLIKLLFLASFGKGLYTLILISYNINNLLIYRFDKGLSLLSTLQYFFQEIMANHLLWLLIVVGIIILIGYVFLFPVGISASIHFLKDKKNHIGTAIGKGTGDFFIMFELVALAFSFGIYTYAITVLRLFTLGILNSTIAMWLIIIWGIAVLFSNIFWQYAKFILVLDREKGIFEAIKKSTNLAIKHISITFKGRIMQLIFFIVFYLKGFVILSVPLLLIYFFTNSNAHIPGWIIWLLGSLTVVLSIYISSIIQAFFRKFWFDIYQNIKALEENED